MDLKRYLLKLFGASMTPAKPKIDRALALRRIDLLNDFIHHLNIYNQSRDHQARSMAFSLINRKLEPVRQAVTGAGVYAVIRLGSGFQPNMGTVDPFLSIFDAPLGISMMSAAVTQVEQAIGVYDHIVQETGLVQLPEQAQSKRDARLELNVDRSINISGGHIGAVNQGDHAQVSVNQNTQNNASLKELAELLREYVANAPGLEGPKKEEALDQVEVIVEEADRPQPRPSRVKAAVAYLKGIVEDAHAAIGASTELYALLAEIQKAIA